MHTSAYEFALRPLYVTSALVPLIYITLVILKRLLWKRNLCFHKLITSYLRKRSNENVENHFADRVLHPSAYYGSCTPAVGNHMHEIGTY